MLGTLTGQIVMFFTLIYLTKIYTPQSFGIFGTFQSVIGTTWVISTMRYDLAIPVASDDKEKTSLSILSILLALCFSSLLLVLYPILTLFFEVQLWVKPFFWYLAVVGVFIIATYFTFEYYTVSYKRFNTVSLSKMFQIIGVSIVQLGLGFIYPNEYSLIIGYLCGFIISIVILSWDRFKNKDIINVDNKVIVQVIELSKKYKNFPKFSMPATLANIASFNIPVMLVGEIFSAEQAGYFFLAHRVIGVPIDILTNSISQVFLGNSSSMLLNKPSKISTLFLRILKTMFLVGLIPFMLLYFTASPIIDWLFGMKWHEIGKIVELCTIMYFVRMITTPLSHILNVLNQLKAQLFWDISRLFLIVLLFILAKCQNLSISNFTFLFSVLMATMYIVHTAIGYYYINQISSK